jgi:hypothetical protein
VARHGERVVNLRGRAYWATGRPSAQYMLVVRVLPGWMNILAQLDCSVAARGLAQRWVPGFAGGLTRLGGGAAPKASEHIPGTNGCGEIGRSSC